MGHHGAVFAVYRLRAWHMALPCFVLFFLNHNSNSISESICNLTRFKTFELSHATKTGQREQRFQEEENPAESSLLGLRTQKSCCKLDS